MTLTHHGWESRPQGHSPGHAVPLHPDPSPGHPLHLPARGAPHLGPLISTLVLGLQQPRCPQDPHRLRLPGQAPFQAALPTSASAPDCRPRHTAALLAVPVPRLWALRPQTLYQA